MSRIAFDHELARLAAGRFDALADSLEGGFGAAAGTLRPVAAAQDAVSVHTAQTLGAVGDSFEQAFLGGVVELRKIAANLRLHADLHETADGDAVDSFRPLM